MKAYIISSKAISAQNSLEANFPFNKPIAPSLKMSAFEPEYKQYLPPLKLRRMSRIVRMGLTSALECVKAANIEKPGGIVTATGWGCLADTHKFLTEMGEKDEQLLSPATFIQSTHNTVGGQIALMLQCEEYNSVYVHHTASFEHSLLDSLLLIAEGKDNILVGGVDEIMEADYDLKRRSGYWKEEGQNLDLKSSNTKGTIAGEGSIFFVLSSEKRDDTNALVAGTMVSSTPNTEALVNNLLIKWGLEESEIDVVLSGIDGDVDNNQVYTNFQKKVFPDAMHAYYKNLCGDFDTSPAFALWLAERIIKNQELPDSMLLQNSGAKRKQLNHILIHHYTNPSEHAFILVSKAGL